MNALKLTPDVKIDLCDLMTEFDPESEITIRSIFNLIWNSPIPIDIWKELLQCDGLDCFWEELNSKPFEDEGDIEYLELVWGADIGPIFNGEMLYSSGWQFHGVGYPDVVPDDFKEQEIKVEPGYRQAYAIELSPLYKLSDYPIHISDEISIMDYEDESCKTISLRPSITVLQLFYEVIWELSFFGDVESRDSKIEELRGAVENYKKAKEDGTLQIVKGRSLEEFMRQVDELGDISDEEE